ncbi:MAG: DUF4136 domain-containing protein [Gammaproteobacteria bacterium]|nr:MAG: DUF4136 domain-containing protein [Gammaproteobacteria bacterium]
MRQLLKHFRQLGIFTAAILLISACATSSKVTQDFKAGTDFHSYKTFSWHNFSSDVPASDQIAIQHEVEQQLSQQGFQLVSGAADLILDLNIIKHAASSSSTGVGLSIGLPIGRHGGLGLGTNKLLGKDTNVVALIILDVTAQSTNEVLWRGSAEDVPLDNFSVRNKDQLATVIGKLVKQFPPK